MKLYCATTAVSIGEELYAFGLRNTLISYAWFCRPDFARKVRVNYREFWLAGAEERGRRMRLWTSSDPAVTVNAERTPPPSRYLSAISDEWPSAIAQWADGRPAAVDLFLDCGAYSSHVSGAVVPFEEYCRFCAEQAGALSAYVQFDVVGDAAATAKNLEDMEQMGLRPLPVYTAAAPLSRLEELCERYGHVCLGGLRGREAGSTDWRREKLDQVFKAAERYWPVKFHAFGVAAQWLLERYPLYSADSSAVILGAGMGRVLSFPGEDGIFSSYDWDVYARLTCDQPVMDRIGMTHKPDGSGNAGRLMRNVQSWLALERYATELWASRGVTWDGPGEG